MKNYIQSQEFHNKTKYVADHAFFKQSEKGKKTNTKQLYLAKQIHSNHVITLHQPLPSETIEGDAIVTNLAGINLAIQTADCVPVLLIDINECIIGAIHAGWKSAKSGIIENTLIKMSDLGAKKQNIIAAIGPCIHQESYEVSEDFTNNFINDDINNKIFFIRLNSSYMFDLPGYVKKKLQDVQIIYDCNVNTYTNQKDFASYRRTTHKKSSLTTRNISTIKLLKSTDGTSEWKSSIQNIVQYESNKKFYQTQNTASYNFQPKKNNIPQYKLDLHGYNKEKAYNRLKDFIKEHFSLGSKSLLIITGKGSGILRENVYKWLKYSNLNKYVLNFTKAKLKDGGDGSIYLNLKRNDVDK